MDVKLDVITSEERTGKNVADITLSLESPFFELLKPYSRNLITKTFLLTQHSVFSKITLCHA
jgi:hypothetical protein